MPNKLNKLSPLTVPNTEITTLFSSNVGRDFKIFVGLPKNYSSSNQSFPVLYLLDGNAFFSSILEIIRLLNLFQELSEMIVVGIGYPVDHPVQALGFRFRDMAPSENDEFLERFAGARPGLFEADGSGKAHNFLAFISKELKPYIQSEYRILANDSALLGHSLGGLFSLYVLFNHINIFNRYLIGSPSIVEWDEELVWKYEMDYAASNKDMVAKVFMYYGQLEPEEEIEGMLRLSRKLKGRHYQGLDLETCVLEGETHNSVLPALVGRGLKAVFS